MAASRLSASALAVTLFLGGWSLPGVHLTGWLGLAVSVAVFLAKVGFFLFLFVWVRWSLPRFRYDQVLKFAWKFMLPLALVNLVVTVVWMWARHG